MLSPNSRARSSYKAQRPSDRPHRPDREAIPEKEAAPSSFLVDATQHEDFEDMVWPGAKEKREQKERKAQEKAEKAAAKREAQGKPAIAVTENVKTHRQHPIVGGIAGFFFFLFLMIELLVFGVLASNSILMLVLPILGIVVGVALAKLTPLGGRTPRP